MIKSCARLLLVLFLSAMVAWADSDTVPGGSRLVLELPRETTAAQLDSTLDIIKARMDDLSSYRIELSGSVQAPPVRVTMTTGNDANESGLRMRLTRRGVLAFKSLDGTRDLTLQRDDIRKVRGGIELEPPALVLRLSEAASARLTALATEPRLLMFIDGDSLGWIRRPLRQDGMWALVGPGLDAATVAALSLVVSNGPLPVQPRLVKILPPAPHR